MSQKSPLLRDTKIIKNLANQSLTTAVLELPVIDIKLQHAANSEIKVFSQNCEHFFQQNFFIGEGEKGVLQ